MWGVAGTGRRGGSPAGPAPPGATPAPCQPPPRAADQTAPPTGTQGGGGGRKQAPQAWGPGHSAGAAGGRGAGGATGGGSLCRPGGGGSRPTTLPSPPTDTRVGTVLMNMPIMASTPGNSAGRPDTVVPNTTSRPPPWRDNRIAHAPCRILFTLSPLRPAAARSAAQRSGHSSPPARAVRSARFGDRRPV